ncbi:conjugal transfer protein [Roseburia sp. 1XD42-69]|nr:cysteine-rich KTR domain-containing protein [Roseburia sp. 1XD42-69]RKJ60160.1 conjugal transfer protein [Roseburia sp. 1XD42-69]
MGCSTFSVHTYILTPRIREDTVLINYPLYCPKCKQETLIEAKNLKITVIKEPDTQMQSR